MHQKGVSTYHVPFLLLICHILGLELGELGSRPSFERFELPASQPSTTFATVAATAASHPVPNDESDPFVYTDVSGFADDSGDPQPARLSTPSLDFNSSRSRRLNSDHVSCEESLWRYWSNKHYIRGIHGVVNGWPKRKSNCADWALLGESAATANHLEPFVLHSYPRIQAYAG